MFAQPILKYFGQWFCSRLPFTNQRGTDIGTALNYTMREVFNTPADRPDAVNVIVVLTDGKTFWDGGISHDMKHLCITIKLYRGENFRSYLSIKMYLVEKSA